LDDCNSEGGETDDPDLLAMLEKERKKFDVIQKQNLEE